jgi:outer membrane protein OmpA-like peptidoglycan-associated protein
MKARRCFFLLVVTALGAAQLCLAQAKPPQDKKGCKDSPLISRFPGSVITECEDKDDKSYDFAMPGAGHQTVEGEYHYLEYRGPDSASNAELARNMGTALRNAGYKMLFESGNHNKFVGQMGKTWIQIEISSNGEIWENIVTETTLTQEVVANAAELSTGISGSGHIVVNGILFDTAKADVKPESKPALDEVAKMLKENASLKVYVVGHTDNVGALAGNLDLSKRRAAAVVQELISKYGIAAARLAPFGAGPYAPIASNDKEDGRALNRRVELVKQ